MDRLFRTKILVRHQGKYLLLKKVKDINKNHVGKWEVPGGKLKANEDPKLAAIREIKEETGLMVKNLTNLKTLKLKTDEAMITTYAFLVEALTNKIKLSDEHSDYKWLVPTKIKTLKGLVYPVILIRYIKMAEAIKG